MDWGNAVARQDAAAGGRRLVPLLAALAGALLVVLAVFASEASSETCTEREVEIEIVKAKGCFEEVKQSGADPFFRISKEFTMNGFRVTPGSGTHVDFIPASNADGRKRGAQVKSSGGLEVATSGADPWRWKTEGFNFNPPSEGKVLLLQGKLAQPVQTFLGLQPGVGFDEPVYLNDEGGGEFSLTFDIASIMKMVDKNQSFNFDFEVEEDGKINAVGIEGEIRGISIAKLVEVDELGIDLKTKNGIVTGLGGDITASFKALKDVGVHGDFAWEENRLQHLGFGIVNANAPFGSSGIFMQDLGFDVFLAPPYGGKGHIAVTAGKQVKVFGKDVAAVRADGTVEIRGADTERKKPPWFSVDAGLAVIGIPVSSAHFRYDFGVGTEFSARVGIGLPSLTNDPNQPTYVGVQASGWTSAQHFLLRGEGTIRAIGFDIFKGDTVVSDIGAGVCTKILWWWGGLGVRWSDGLVSDIGGGTCDIGRYIPVRGAAAALASARKTPLQLGHDHEIIRVRGAGDAPQVALRHEDGRVLHAPPPDDEDGMLRGDQGVSLAGEDDDTTYFMIRDPKGEWTVEQKEGSAAVTQIAIAKELPPHRLRASLRGKGVRRTLDWRSRDIEDQKLVFVEVLRNGTEVPILTTRKHRGSKRVRLASGLGTYGKRKLRVHVLQRFETPRDVLTADRYKVAAPPEPDRPRRLRANRRLRDVVVHWQPGKHAREQEVVIRTGRGGRYAATVGPRARSHRFRDLSAGRRLVVTVRGLDRDGIGGPAARKIVKNRNHVKNDRDALRRLLRTAHVAGGRAIAANAACPDEGAHCDLTLTVRKGKKRLGRETITLPPDMTDRLRVPLSKGATRQLRRTGRIGGVTIRAAIEVGDEVSRSSRKTALRR